MTFEELTEKYLDYCKVDQQPGWIKQKARILQRMAGHFPMPVEEIDNLDVSKYAHERLAGCKPRTMNNDISILRAIFEFAADRNLISHNPVTTIRRVRADVVDVQIYTPKEINAMIHHARGKDKQYMILLKNTLARVGEINDLRWRDVNLAHNVVWLGKSRSSTKPRRAVPLNGPALGALTHLAGRCSLNPDAYVFGFRDKRRMLKRLCAKIGVPYRGFHAIRRGMATALLEKGTSIKYIADVLGHKNIQNTQYYLRTSDKALRETVGSLEEM